MLETCILPAASPGHFPHFTVLQEQVILKRVICASSSLLDFPSQPLFYKRGRLVWELPKTIVCTMSLVWQRNCDRRYSVQNYLAVSCCSVAVREWTFLREEKKIGIPSSSFEHYRLRTPKTSVNTNIYPYNFKSWLQAWFNLQDFLKSGIGSRLSLGLAAGQVDVFSGYRCMQGCSKAAT